MRKAAFVPVSRWLKEHSQQSSLIRNLRIEVIPNAFKSLAIDSKKDEERSKIRLLFGAARLDDPIKGLDVLRETSRIIARDHPEIACKLELALFGVAKDAESLKGFGLPLLELGTIHGDKNIAEVYRAADVLVSAATEENLPGTLVEAQAYGCIPVSFDRGGQKDIIEDKATGYLAHYVDDKHLRAQNLAEGIIWAVSAVENKERLKEMRIRMKESVERKFSYSKVVSRYVSLIKELESK